jgi:hypothetical protein
MKKKVMATRYKILIILLVNLSFLYSQDTIIKKGYFISYSDDLFFLPICRKENLILKNGDLNLKNASVGFHLIIKKGMDSLIRNKGVFVDFYKNENFGSTSKGLCILPVKLTYIKDDVLSHQNEYNYFKNHRKNKFYYVLNYRKNKIKLNFKEEIYYPIKWEVFE